MRERLVRFLIIGLAAFLILSLARVVAGWQAQPKTADKSASFSQTPVKEKLEEWSGNVLGKAADLLPGVSERDEADQENQEPIEKPVQDVQQQVDSLIEAIKKLPQDQLEATKKQIYKEFCKEVSDEEQSD